MSKPPAIVRYSHENEVKQRTLDNKLRRFRIRVEEGEKEDHYLDHLLDILLNRFAHVLNQHSTLYFVAGYLNDAGFNISKSSIESRVRTQKRHKPFNYKPYLKINLDFITKYNTSIVHNDCLLKIYCVLKDSSGSKRVTKCLFQGPSARCYGQQKLYKTTFLSLKPWLEHIEIRTVVKPIRFTFASLVDLLLFRNRFKMTPVVLPPVSLMPLTGFKDCFEVFWRIKPNDYQICFSYNLEIEFCDHPKRVQCFRKQKLKIHKQLYLDTIKKYTNLDLVPQQVQSLIKLHGQQNQIATEEDRSILNEAISELDSLKVLQQEKLIRQQMRFFPKAPPPSSPPPPDMQNHCGSTKKPPKGPPGFIPKINRKHCLTTVQCNGVGQHVVHVNMALIRTSSTTSVNSFYERGSISSRHEEGPQDDSGTPRKTVLVPTVTQWGTVVFSQYEENMETIRESQFLFQVGQLLEKRLKCQSLCLKDLVSQCLSSLPPNKLNVVWINHGNFYRREDACLVRKAFEVDILKNDKFLECITDKKRSLQKTLFEVEFSTRTKLRH